MKSTTPLLVASQSKMRHRLLNDMGIAYQVITQNVDEKIDATGIAPHELPLAIALHKMNHVSVPETYPESIAYILTADTLGFDRNGISYGKPRDHAQARVFLKALRGTNYIVTGFVVHKRMKDQQGIWQIVEQLARTVTTECVCAITDMQIEEYLGAVPEAMSACGALTVEGYGSQFIKSFNGSYTSVLGLPVYELREELELIGFFK